MRDLPAEARDLLAAWLPPDDDAERPVMSLATVDAEGAPDVRSVLLSGADDDGFHLHTDARSRKVAQLTARPVAALLLRWPEELRQLVVRGRVSPVPESAAAAAYARRAPYLQQLAWVNTDDLAGREEAERRASWAAFAAERAGTTLAPPPTWVGFVVRPTSLTFWLGDPDGPSRRVEFRHDGAAWGRRVLAG